MGQIRRLIPNAAKERMLSSFNERFPDGKIRRNAADAITYAGGVCVVAGAALDRAGYKRTGATLRAVGQVADDLDGDVARALGTSGRSGALADSIVDKGKALVELGTLYLHTRENTDIPDRRRSQLAFIATKHLVNAGLNLYTESQGQEASSNWYGKANMWADGLSFAGWGVADAAKSRTGKIAGEVIGTIGFTAGVVLGTLAAADYLKTAVEAQKSNSGIESF